MLEKLKKLKPQIGIFSISLIGLTAMLLASDLITKYLEEVLEWRATIIPGFIYIRCGVRNAGCAFSFLDDRPEIGQPIFITLTIVLLIAIIALFIFLPEKHRLQKIAMSFIIAGAIGNLVDRIMLFEVRDWFGLGIFGICNFADFWIVIGAVMAVVDLMFLNEWAVFPLTKRAKEAQAKRNAEEEAKKAAEVSAESVAETPAASPDGNAQKDVDDGE